MDEFRLQESFFKLLRKERPSVHDGMSLVLDRLGAAHGATWERCRDIPWESGLERWVAWFDNLLATHPIPEDTEVLWFEVPSELNPAYTTVSAYAQLGPEDDSFGLEEDRTWPQDDDGITLPAALHDLPELEEALQRVGWRETDHPSRQQLVPGVYALLYSYVTLLVINGLPRTRVLSVLDAPKGLAVVLGWAEGDVDHLGQLVAGKWKPIRRVRES